jgi:hypothetical protein
VDVWSGTSTAQEVRYETSKLLAMRTLIITPVIALLALPASAEDSTIRAPRYSCERWTQSYPDVLKYPGRCSGRLKVRLLRTDWVQFTAWRPFRSS